jgi:hypothetical protein
LSLTLAVSFPVSGTSDEGRRVGEVHAEKALGVRQSSSKITNRQRRGVAADHCVRAGRLLNAAQHWPLDVRPFEDRFFDKVCVRNSLGHAVGGSEVLPNQFR